MKISLKTNKLTLSFSNLTKEIDVSKTLKVKLYNRIEKRDIYLSDFEIGEISLYKKKLSYCLFNKKHEILIPISINFSKNSFSVRVSVGSIVEGLGSAYRIMEISLFTDLMKSYVSNDGFYLLPNYTGALVKFDSHNPTKNRDRIYMEQKNWEKFGLINCFASKVADFGILAIIDEGDFHAWCDTELNIDKKNFIYGSFGIRHDFGEVLPQETKKIIYHFLPKCSGYPDMALKYRSYLMKKYNLIPLKNRIDKNPVLKYSSEAMRVKIFMGVKQRPYEFDGSSPLEVCTTFLEAEKILEAMKDAGIKKAIITIVGWNMQGHDGAYPTRFPVENKFGGEKGLKKLIKKALKTGYQIVPHDNVTCSYLNAPTFDDRYVSLDENGDLQASGIWANGLAYKLCPTVSMERYGGDFDKIKRLGFQGSYYLDAQATALFRCTNPKHPADEKQFALSLARILQYPRFMYGAVATETAPAYNLSFIDEVARLHGESEMETFAPGMPESFVKMIDRIVPFYN